VRQIESGAFTLTHDSTLGGIPIHKRVEQPRKVRADGSPDLEVFALVLRNPDDRAHFAEGSEVELSP
jgi:hypothetical protein